MSFGKFLAGASLYRCRFFFFFHKITLLCFIMYIVRNTLRIPNTLTFKHTENTQLWLKVCTFYLICKSNYLLTSDFQIQRKPNSVYPPLNLFDLLISTIKSSKLSSRIKHEQPPHFTDMSLHPSVMYRNIHTL